MPFNFRKILTLFQSHTFLLHNPQNGEKTANFALQTVDAKSRNKQEQDKESPRNVSKLY